MDFIRVNIDRWLYAICAVLSLPRQALADQHLRCGSVSAFLSVLDINSDFVRRFKRLSTTDTSVPGKRAIKICRTWGMPLSPPSQNWSKTTILVQIHREKWPYTGTRSGRLEKGGRVTAQRHHNPHMRRAWRRPSRPCAYAFTRNNWSSPFYIELSTIYTSI